MRIGIIGGGSIGLLYASYLARTNEVTIYTRNASQAEHLAVNGVSVKLNGSIQTVSIHASNRSVLSNNEEIIIIAVKQYDLEDVLTQFTDLANIKTILFLQNGMGHIDLFHQLNCENIIVGVVEHGARKINETTVIHNGIGKTNLALFRGEIKTIQDLIKRQELIEEFPILIVEDWWNMLIKKLIVNSVINPLTAIFRVENGMLVQNYYFHKMMKELYDEIVSVFEIENDNYLFEQIVQICNNTSNNRSSMLSDIENGRPTEIDAILGFVLSQAKQKKIELPITSFLYHAIKGIEVRGG